MLVSKVYEEYEIPRNLQKHMLRTAGVAKLIMENWKGPELNQDDVMTTMLVHDLGNIAKMDVENKEFKKNFIQRYGNDDHIATYNIVKEIGLKSRVLGLILNHIFPNNERTADVEDYELKICTYSDQRVAPFGVVSLDERFEDLKERYPGAEDRYPRTEQLIEAAHQIEEQVLERTTLQASDITEKKVSGYFDNLGERELETV